MERKEQVIEEVVSKAKKNVINLMKEVGYEILPHKIKFESKINERPYDSSHMNTVYKVVIKDFFTGGNDVSTAQKELNAGNYLKLAIVEGSVVNPALNPQAGLFSNANVFHSGFRNKDLTVFLLTDELEPTKLLANTNMTRAVAVINKAREEGAIPACGKNYPGVIGK